MMVFCVGCKRDNSCDSHSARINIYSEPLCGLPIDKGELDIIEVSNPKGKGKALYVTFMSPDLTITMSI